MMKKYLALALVPLLLGSHVAFAGTVTSMNASGTFQLINMPSTLQAYVGENYWAYINFIYSGQGIEGVSLVGQNLPMGMSLGSISYGANGLDNIMFSGLPLSVGDYTLELLLTDNDGTILTQSIDFNVAPPLTFTTTSLPDATVGQPYSATINFTYPLTNEEGVPNEPNIVFSTLPTGITTGGTQLSSAGGSGSVTISGTPTLAGTASVGIAAEIDDLTTQWQHMPLDVQPAPKASIQPAPVVQPAPVTPSPAVVAPTPSPTNPAKNNDSAPAVSQQGQAPKASVSASGPSTATTAVATAPATPTASPAPSFFRRIANFFAKLRFW